MMPRLLPSLFFRLYEEAQQYKDEELFVAERGWQDWMDDLSVDEVTAVLDAVWGLAHMSIRDMRELVTVSQTAASEVMHIPRRTLQNWEAGVTDPPEYTRMFLAYIIYCEDECAEVEEQC